MLAFAGGGDATLGKGDLPRTQSKWYGEYVQIKACPLQINTGTRPIDSYFGGNQVRRRCNCGWHDGSNPLVPAGAPVPHQPVD